MPPQPLKTGAWDPEEDELLYYWQGKVGNKWSEIAKRIPGRTGQQCAQRWRHKVNPNIRREKWTEDEDNHLMDLVKTFGIGKWAEIARHMQGRTDQQCMGRWRRHLDPAIKRDSWASEEDQRLRSLYQQYGTSWSRISKALKGRTSQQCRARWHQLDSGRSRRSGGGGSGSGGQGSAAGGGRSGSGRRRLSSRSSRRRFDSSDSEEYDDDGDEALSDSEAEGDADLAEGEDQFLAGAQGGRSKQQQFDGAEPQPTVGGSLAAACEPAEPYAVADQPADGGAIKIEVEEGGSDSQGADGNHNADSTLVSVSQRLAQARRQPPPLQQQQHHGVLPLFAPAASPRRSTRSGPNSGMSTPKRLGGGAPDSPHIGVLSPSLVTPPRGGRQASAGYEGEEPGASAQAQGWQRMAQAQGLDDEEAAGAETLLQMAAVFRRGSGELEPAGGSGPLRRSDFITGNTPVKRSPSRRPDPGDLSPSPFKRVHSARGPPDADDRTLEGGKPPQRQAAAAEKETGGSKGLAGGDQSDAEPPALLSGGRRLTAKRSSRRVGSALPFRAAAAALGADSGGLGGGGDDAMDDAVTAESDGRGDGVPGAIAFCDLDAAANHLLSSPPRPVRPSDVSHLTGVGLMSPPPRGVHGGSGAQGAAVNLLSSPKFDRMVAGCATPTTVNGHSQPSPATLALLQSPQASAMLEPFWTPYSSASKEPNQLLHRTPDAADQPSTARRKGAIVRGLFSAPSSATKTQAPSPEPAGAMAAPPVPDGLGSGLQGGDEEAGGQADADGQEAGGGAATSNNNRVVRRLDQHEAWAATAPPGAQDGAANEAPHELCSPLKRARVPLFCGSSPGGGQARSSAGARPEAEGGGPREFGGSGKGFEPSRLNPNGGARGPGGGPRAATARSPGRPASWKVPPASALLMSPPGVPAEKRRLQVPRAVVEAAAMVAAAAAQQQQGQQQQEQEQDGQQQTQQDGQQKKQQQEQQEQQHFPATPMHTRLLDGQQSTSATPTTPSGMPLVEGETLNAGAVSSPPGFETPQQHVRIRQPVAPLPLNNALTAASCTAAGGRDAPAPTGPGGRDNEQQLRAADSEEAHQARANQKAVPEQPPAAGGIVESSLVSPSPLQGGNEGAGLSPASWDTGVMAMLHKLQRTPLTANSLDAHGPVATASALLAPVAEGSAAFAARAPGTGPWPASLSTPVGAPAGAAASVAPRPMAASMQGSQLSTTTPLAAAGFVQVTPASAAMPPAKLDIVPLLPGGSAPPPAAPAGCGAPLPPSWLQGSMPLGARLVPAEAQPQPGSAGLATVLSAGVPKAGASALKGCPAGGAAPAPEPLRGSAEARSRLRALLEGL